MKAQENVKLCYLGYYDLPEHTNEQRYFAFSAKGKMDYLLSVLQRIGYEVEVVSASHTLGSSACPGKVVPLREGGTLRLFSTSPWGSLPFRVISRGWMRAQLFFWLLRNLKRGQPILVYHSAGYARLVALARRVRRFRLILEVEEIYADVTESGSVRRKESSAFRHADAFIFPTDLLNDTLNRKSKPYAVVHGTYRGEPAHDVARLNDRIHVVYAGTFDPRKGGALAAAAAAEYLDNRYHVHIIGSGTKSDTDALLSLIEKVSARTECRLTYDGLLAGEDYIRFLQSCDIGLSTQRPDAAFNETSFPSKVLSYMANGLRVVSIRIAALERSQVSDLLHYYDSDNPAALAAAIQAVDLCAPYDSRERIRRLDDEFCAALSELISR